MTVSRPVMRYHGGKFRLAPWVIKHFPAHKVYVEPFGGAASVLLQKPRSHGEVYNDLDGDMVNVFRVLQDPALRERLVEVLAFTPYARAEFDIAWELTEEPVERARRTFIRAEMGFGSAGATKGCTGFRVDTKRNYGTAMHVWSKMPRGIAEFGERMAGVLIENKPAEHVIKAHDTPETLFYLDPPYLHSTRVIGGGRYYKHEMSDADHASLLELVKTLQGDVCLSGYPDASYSDALPGWLKVECQSRIAAHRGTSLRTEALWLSPSCAEKLLGQSSLFTAEVA